MRYVARTATWRSGPTAVVQSSPCRLCVRAMLLPLVEKDDAASILAEHLGPIDAAKMRLLCTTATASFTSSAWAQDFWRHLCKNEERAAQHSSSNAGVSCWHAEFVSRWGDTHIRTIRRARLQAALQGRGLQLRADSWLCAGYIARRPQVGVLADVVNGVELMAFLFRETRYRECREEIAEERWDEAVEMAVDAHNLREDVSFSPGRYHLPLDMQELSDFARRRAVEEWVVEIHRTGSQEPRAVPQLLQEKVMALLRGEEGVWDVDAPLPAYASLAQAEQSARRADVRRRVAERMSEEEEQLAPHIDVLAAVAIGPVAVEHRFPASLTKRQRARLHDEADELELEHESRGSGSERHLVVWMPP